MLAFGFNEKKKLFNGSNKDNSFVCVYLSTLDHEFIRVFYIILHDSTINHNNIYGFSGYQD